MKYSMFARTLYFFPMALSACAVLMGFVLYQMINDPKTPEHMNVAVITGVLAVVSIVYLFIRTSKMFNEIGKLVKEIEDEERKFE